MKRFAQAIVLVSAGLAGCRTIDSQVAVNDDGVRESTTVIANPSERPLLARWQKLMVKIRENNSHQEVSETASGPEILTVPAATNADVEAQSDKPARTVVHSGGVVHPQKTNVVMQASASERVLPAEPKPTGLPSVVPETPMAKATSSAEAPTATGPVAVREVSSKRIVMDYEIKDIGPSGISTVDLWYTRDGRKWDKCPIGAQRTSPYVLEVKEEGLYGITLVASSGIGLKKRPPRPGDNPQVWIDVDVTKPVVRIAGCTVGAGPEADNLTITWRAQDKHMGERPISLSYAETADGPWSSIAANVENTGSYVWKMPSNVPQRLIVRVEATDLAGNVGMAQTREPVLIDLAKPTVSILSVKPAAN
jgi:hypothetical protein